MNLLLRIPVTLAALVFAATATLVPGRAAPPEGIVPVSPFDVSRYLGRWYEIARLDHSFERGLRNVTAEYSLRPDGTLNVLNRGFDTSRCEFTERTGQATFDGPSDTASLSVTFFWPFSGGYHVFLLDSQYRYAAVAGPNRRFLWILAREPELPQSVLRQIVATAGRAGFPVDDLIYVDQDQPDCG